MNLTASDLWFSYDEKGLLPDLVVSSVAIKSGEILTFGGSSGSGKSTLVHLLCGLEKAQAGSILWDDIDISSQPQSKRTAFRLNNMGFLFQDFCLIPSLSPLENILLPLRYDRFVISKSDKQRALSLTKKLGLSRLPSHISKMSKGEQQRVSVARALIREPKILIADEPSASLDLGNEQKLAELLLEINREFKTTMIICTHSKNLRDIGHKQIMLDHGKILEGEKTA